jgi:hypothetical protein
MTIQEDKENTSSLKGKRIFKVVDGVKELEESKIEEENKK